MASVPPVLLASAAKLLNRSPLRRPTAAVLDFLTQNPSPLAFVERTAAREPTESAFLDTNATPYVVRFAPPLTITKEQIDWALDTFRDVLRELEAAG